MPNFNSHIWMGIIIGLIGGAFIYTNSGNIWIAIYCLIFAAVGALLPDIDTHSKISKAVMIASVILLIVAAIWFRQYVIHMAVIVALIVFLIYVVKHRTITHTLIAAIVYTGVAYFMTNNIVVTVCALAGYASHLFLDKF